MTTVHLSSLGRHERRLRHLWSAEPARGQWILADDEARDRVSAECAQHGLDYWMTVEGAQLTLPDDQGDFLWSAGFFHLLGITIAAFPTPEIRDAVVVATPGAHAVADDAFWP